MRGFSLIELIMIVLVASIIGAVIVMGMRQTPYATLDLATKKISNDIVFIREKSITTGKMHKIYLTVPDKVSAGFGNYTLILNPENQSEFTYNLSNHYEDTTFFKNYSVQFDSLGRATFKNQTSIIIKTSKGQKIIKIDPSNGRVYVN